MQVMLQEAIRAISGNIITTLLASAILIMGWLFFKLKSMHLKLINDYFQNTHVVEGVTRNKINEAAKRCSLGSWAALSMSYIIYLSVFNEAGIEMPLPFLMAAVPLVVTGLIVVPIMSLIYGDKIK